MRTTLTLLISMLLLGSANAQNRPTHSRWSLDVMAGPSIPVGKFASKSLGPGPLVTQTQTGFDAGLVLNYGLNRFFGLCLAVDGQQNPFANYGDVLSGMIGYHYYVYPGKIARLMTGARVGLPLAARRRLILQIRALAGLLKAYRPAYDQTAFGITETYHVPGTSVPTAFGYQADMGLKWRISLHNFVFFNVGYAGADAAFHYHYTNVAIGVPTDVRSPVPTGSMQIRIGAEIGL